MLCKNGNDFHSDNECQNMNIVMEHNPQVWCPNVYSGMEQSDYQRHRYGAVVCNKQMEVLVNGWDSATLRLNDTR